MRATKDPITRIEVGEIASRIGQLYVEYYHRTSDLNYLNEAFSFYTIIRERGYFGLSETAILMSKKLRFYGRFIVLCIFQSKQTLVKILFDEISIIMSENQVELLVTDLSIWRVIHGEVEAYIAVNFY